MKCDANLFKGRTKRKTRVDSFRVSFTSNDKYANIRVAWWRHIEIRDNPLTMVNFIGSISTSFECIDYRLSATS